MSNSLNYFISNIPNRPDKPRKSGITMVMDKGLSTFEAKSIISSSVNSIDYIKLGFGTSAITGNIDDKIKIYQQAGINVYLGGTLFEAFYVRNLLDEYMKVVKRFNLDTIEISDGCIEIDHDIKCELINKYSKNFTVLSEVGSKDAEVHYNPEKWVGMMKKELDAGSFKVIAEARESGNVGIYSSNGKAETSLIDIISENIDSNNIIWEAPLKAQQVWFIKKYGHNVNLGNIASNEVIALETLRLGLRGDTFFDFLPK